MSTKKSENHHRLSPIQQPSRFEYIVIIENNETDYFIHETLLNTLSLGSRVEKRSSMDEMLKELSTAKRLDEIPDVLLLSIEPKNLNSSKYLDEFNKLPDLIRAKCKLIIISSSNSKEDKLRAIMNPNVIRYLEKPIDVCHFRDFMFS